MDENELEDKIKISSRGGTRIGAGRPKGQTNKISGATILESIEKYAGEKFEDLLAQGYWDSITQQDKQTRLQYEKMFLSKVVADKVEVDMRVTEDVLESKKQAFIAAMNAMSKKEAQ